LKLKLDENLPGRLVIVLGDAGHEVDTVHSERLTGHDDVDVWAAAQRDERFLITQDLDFSDARKYVPRTHHGLLLVRLRRPGRAALFDRIRHGFSGEDVESWTGCLAVVTEQKVRVIHPRARTDA
jgi:hypothetical protein